MNLSSHSEPGPSELMSGTQDRNANHHRGPALSDTLCEAIAVENGNSMANGKADCVPRFWEGQTWAGSGRMLGAAQEAGQAQNRAGPVLAPQKSQRIFQDW